MANNLQLRQRWEAAVDLRKKNLERRDRERASSPQSWSHIENQIKDKLYRQQIVHLEPGLSKLKSFVDVVLPKFVPSIDCTVLLGLCRLLLQLLTTDIHIMVRIPKMLHQIGHKVEDFSDHCPDTLVDNERLSESAVEIAIIVLDFFAEAVNFLRRPHLYTTPGDSLENEWQDLASRFSTAFEELKECIERVKGIAAMLTISPVTDVVPAGQNDPVSWPCIVQPPIRTSRFFDREADVMQLDTFFDNPEFAHPIRSMAIHGLAGVGKSTIALRYAELMLQRRQVDALFWIHGENPVSMKQSFTDVALKLKLPGAQRGDEDENVKLVRDWLAQTDRRWFVVYDNVESMELLRAHWPYAGTGKILITTRYRLFTAKLADHGLEVNTWPPEKGAQFVQQLLQADVVTTATQIVQRDHASSRELSCLFDGHALALTLISGLIQESAWSLEEFMQIYQTQPEDIHSVLYHEHVGNGTDVPDDVQRGGAITNGALGAPSIRALWIYTFERLKDDRYSDSRALLGVLSFLAPDSIPQDIFTPQRSGMPACSLLPSNLAFCSNQIRFSRAVGNLVNLTLVKRDVSTRTFSIHRLVQASYRAFLTSEGRQQIWWDTAKLVSGAFPRRDSTVAQLYHMWDRCSLYLQHVLSLKTSFAEEWRGDSNFKALPEYCDLNNACQRYLLEINAYTELQELIEVNEVAIATLPYEQQTVALNGSLTSHKGQLLSRLGNSTEGVEWLLKSYDMRHYDEPFLPRESAWAAENAANGMASLNQYSKAIEWHEKAHRHWTQWSDCQTEPQPWPATLKKSFAITLIWARQNTRARELAESALVQIEETKPYNWAMAAYTHFVLAAVDRYDGRHDRAEEHLMEAQNRWLRGDQLRADPFNGACMYRLGCVALDQGNVSAAIKHLKDAKVITQLRESTMKAEHARCLFKLSEALEQDPHGLEEAQQYREEAEKLLYSIDAGASSPGLERTYDELVHIQWR